MSVSRLHWNVRVRCVLPLCIRPLRCFTCAPSAAFIDKNSNAAHHSVETPHDRRTQGSPPDSPRMLMSSQETCVKGTRRWVWERVGGGAVVVSGGGAGVTQFVVTRATALARIPSVFFFYHCRSSSSSSRRRRPWPESTPENNHPGTHREARARAHHPYAAVDGSPL